MKKTQNGRSMVEILGIMVVIGVLSISWIPAYTVVMNRHRANKILDMASKVAVFTQSMNGGHGGCVAVVSEGGTVPGDCSEGLPFMDTRLVWYPTAGVTGFLAETSDELADGYVTVHINAPFERVQQTMAAIAGEDYDISENTIRVKTY